MSDDRQGNRTRRADLPTTTGRAEGRVPPHNLEAEESLLGAALLSKVAAEVLATTVKREDFYRPAHGAIAAAITSLFLKEQPVDPTTVSDVLRRTGELDMVGGPAALIGISARTPATSSAPHYAALVRDHATLRQVIAAAGQIADLGYGLPADVHEAVTRAQLLISSIGGPMSTESFSSLDFGDVAALLAGTLPRIDPELLIRTDGQALFYPGRMHLIHGEPTGGKTWIALIAIVMVLAVGGSALYLDYEDSLAGIISRLLALGADPEDLRTRFQYVKQEGPFGPSEKLDLAAKLRSLNPDIVVIDGVAEALTRDGFSEDKATDVVTWIEKLPRWIARTGAAVVMLDHVAKDRENRGRWARGSGAKLGAVDGAAYEVIVREAFSRKRAGRVELKIAKDRPGGVGENGSIAASITITPHADGERVVMEVGPPREPMSTADAWKPTITMKRVSDELERAVSPITVTAMVTMIGGDKKAKDRTRSAITRLEAEGWIRLVKHGSASVMRLAKPYRDDETPPPPDEPPPTLDLDSTSNVVVGPWESLTDFEKDRVLLDGATHIEDPDNEGDT